MESSNPDLSKIELLILDVDGTLTDGGIYYDEHGVETKKFNAKDGLGIAIVQKAGVEVMLLTGRTSKIVERRGLELKIKYIVQGEKDKAGFLQQFWQEKRIISENTAFVGDDLNDLDAMKLIPHTACPADAADEIKQISEIVLKRNGGFGAVREYIDLILKSKGATFKSSQTNIQ